MCQNYSRYFINGECPHAVYWSQLLGSPEQQQYLYHLYKGQEVVPQAAKALRCCFLLNTSTCELGSGFGVETAYCIPSISVASGEKAVKQIPVLWYDLKKASFSNTHILFKHLSLCSFSELVLINLSCASHFATYIFFLFVNLLKATWKVTAPTMSHFAWWWLGAWITLLLRVQKIVSENPNPTLLMVTSHCQHPPSPPRHPTPDKALK